jgi:hypothetical protein
MGGYYLVFWGWRFNAHEELVKRLDTGDYNQEETVEIKIPIALPYPLQQNDYERTNGKFEYQAEHYKLVKHKLTNDTLYIVAIKDHQAKEIENALKDYSKLSNDLPSSEKSQSHSLVKLIKEFEPFISFELISRSGWVSQTLFSPLNSFNPNVNLSIPSPPPDLIV